MGRRAPRAGGRRAKRFGRLLKRLRVKALVKRAAYDQVEGLLKTQGILPIAGSTLQRYEMEGRIPDMLAVAAMAAAYRVNAEALARALLVDLTYDSVTLDELERIARGGDLTGATPMTGLSGDLSKPGSLPEKGREIPRPSGGLLVSDDHGSTSDARTSPAAAVTPDALLSVVRDVLVDLIDRIDRLPVETNPDAAGHPAERGRAGRGDHR